MGNTGFQVVYFEPKPSFKWHTVRVCRTVQWLKAFGGVIRAWAIPAFLSWAGSVIVAGLTLALLYSPSAGLLGTEGLGAAIAGVVASLALLGGIFLFVVLWAALTAHKNIAETGYWAGNRFIFHTPVPVATILAEAKNSKRRLLVTVPKAVPKFAVIRCEIDNPANSAIFQAVVQSPFYCVNDWEKLVANRSWPTFAGGPISAAVRIGKKRQFFVEWILPPVALPHELRIYMHSFEIQSPNDQSAGHEFFHWHMSQPSNGFDVYGR